jgi:hypothetical protein
MNCFLHKQRDCAHRDQPIYQFRSFVVVRLIDLGSLPSEHERCWALRDRRVLLMTETGWLMDERPQRKPIQELSATQQLVEDTFCGSGDAPISKRSKPDPSLTKLPELAPSFYPIRVGD